MAERELMWSKGKNFNCALVTRVLARTRFLCHMLAFLRTVGAMGVSTL